MPVIQKLTVHDLSQKQKIIIIIDHQEAGVS